MEFRPSRTKRILVYLLAVSLCAPLLPAQTSSAALALRGYSNESARTQRDWETKFRAIPDPANLRAYMQRLSARPHHVGSPYDKDNAEWILAKIQRVGARREDRDLRRALPDAEGARGRAGRADALHGQAGGAGGDGAIRPRRSTQEQLPTYNAYSIDGDVTAPLVYVNYGIPDDYESSSGWASP